MLMTPNMLEYWWGPTNKNTMLRLILNGKLKFGRCPMQGSFCAFVSYCHWNCKYDFHYGCYVDRYIRLNGSPKPENPSKTNSVILYDVRRVLVCYLEVLAVTFLSFLSSVAFRRKTPVLVMRSRLTEKSPKSWRNDRDLALPGRRRLAPRFRTTAHH